MTAVDEIKSRLDIIDIVSETVKLRRTGKNYIGFCPFHANTRTPAFVVFPIPAPGAASASATRAAISSSYVMKKEGWDFPETLRYLADRAGVKLEPLTPAQTGRRRSQRAPARAAGGSGHLLPPPAAANPGRQPGAGLPPQTRHEPETIETFGLGYAPDSWDTACSYFTAKGYTRQDLLQAGLATERQGGEGVYDRFRNRIMFPIRDAAGTHVRLWGAHPQPEGYAQVSQLPANRPVRQGPPALRAGRGPQGHPHPGPGGDRRRLPGCDRPAPGRLSPTWSRRWAPP